MYKCKKCQSSEYTKVGFVKGEQRYKCKKCGCQFVPTRHKGRSEEEKREAVKLYSHGLSFRAIAKLSECQLNNYINRFINMNGRKKKHS